jgi:hypothetical protein
MFRISVPSVLRYLLELEVHAGANSLDGQVRGTVERISTAGAIGDGASRIRRKARQQVFELEPSLPS